MGGVTCRHCCSGACCKHNKHFSAPRTFPIKDRIGYSQLVEGGSMARRYSTSQIRSRLRQAQQKQQRAITKYNDAVRRHHQGVRTAVNRYNQAVRAHNERVRANRRRLASELARLNSKPTITTTSYTVYHTSVRTLQRTYGLLETAADSQQLDARYNRLLDLSVSNSSSGRRWKLDHAPAVGDPTHMVEFGTGRRAFAREA